MIEPYVLLSAPDQGIAADYAAYRDLHRDQLENIFRCLSFRRHLTSRSSRFKLQILAGQGFRMETV